MVEPFLGELRMMAFNFAPSGWALCNGQTMSIQQNQALFSLLGTTYGGNGINTFALPNLQGRVPISFSGTFNLGQLGGETTHTLVQGEMPTHIHLLQADAATLPANNTATPSSSTVLGQSGGTANPSGTYAIEIYNSQGNNSIGTLSANVVGGTGQSQPHDNMQPHLGVSFCITLSGIFPSRN